MKVFRVVVASPGDVAKERDLIDVVAKRLNATYDQIGLPVRVDIIRWETHAGLGFNDKGPQFKVDEHLKSGDCDILIGIFWTRFGAKTVDGESPTQHEISLAIKAAQDNGRPEVLLYFRSGAQPRNQQETTQVLAVQDFRADVITRVIIKDYSSELEFERSVHDQIFQITFPRKTDETTKSSALPLLALEAVPRILRSNGVAELLADLVFNVAGIHAGRRYDIQFVTQPPVNITSQLQRDRGSSVQLFRRKNGNELFVKVARQDTNNSLVFEDVEIDAGALRDTSFRIAGVRVNASQLGVSAGHSAPVSGFLVIREHSNHAPIARGIAKLGLAISPTAAFSVIPSDKGDRLQLSQLSAYGVPSTNDQVEATFSVSLKEGFEGAFKSLSEEAGNASAVTNGTRFLLSLADIPNGLRVFVTATDSIEKPQCILFDCDPIGGGGSASQSAGPVVEKSSGSPLVEIPIVGASGQAVWEWVALSTPGALREARQSIVVMRDSEILSPGQIRVNYELCPISPTQVASSAAPIPRFALWSSIRTALTLTNDVTRLLFPFVSNQGGFDTGITISNVSGGPLGTRPQIGACAIMFYGTVGTSLCTLSYPSPPIATGQHFVWSLAAGGAVAATPGFQGYIVAECDFPARGFAFVSKVGQDSATCYLAEVLPSGAKTP